VVSILFTCVKVPDYCDRNVTYDPDHQFCFAGLAYPLCNNGNYNPLTEGCDENNFVGTMCADGSFVPPGTHCGGYTLNTASAPVSGGRIIRTTEGPNYAAGYNLVVIAEAAAGYTFAGWTGASTSTDMTVTIRMDSNKPLVAMFRPATSTLATTAFPPDGGTIERVENGIMVTVTATTTAGYTFVGWSGASTSTEPTVTVTVDEGKTLVAMFAPATHTLTVNASPSAGGTLFVNGTASSGATRHDAGTQVEVSARTTEGYLFMGWSGAATGIDNPVTIPMTSNQTLTANFQRQNIGDTIPPPPIAYTLTVNAGTGGTVSPSGTSTHYANTPVTITATAAGGYTFSNWAVTGGGTVASPNSATTTVTLTSNATVTANFRYADDTQPPGSPERVVFRTPIPKILLAAGATPPDTISRGQIMYVTVEVQDRFGNAVNQAVQVSISSSNVNIGDAGVPGTFNAATGGFQARTVLTNPATGIATFTARVTNGVPGQTFDMTATITVAGGTRNDVGALRIGRTLDRLEVFYADTVGAGATGQWQIYQDMNVSIFGRVGDWFQVTVKAVAPDTVIRTKSGCIFVEPSNPSIILSATPGGAPANTFFTMTAGSATFWIGADPGMAMDIPNACLDVAMRMVDCTTPDHSIMAGNRCGITFVRPTSNITNALVHGDGT
jgi:uncharacterized repeat protein (TIGR02543 family)